MAEADGADIDAPAPKTEVDEALAAEPADGLVDDPASAIPPPITPDSSAQAHRVRAQYETQVNAQVAGWIDANREAITNGFLNGQTVELVIGGQTDDADDSDSDIAPETALAAALDAGLTPYSEWTNAELSEECENRGLAKSGTKDELVARLEESDAQDVADEDETAAVT